MLGLHGCGLADQLHAQSAICSEQDKHHFSRLNIYVVCDVRSNCIQKAPYLMNNSQSKLFVEKSSTNAKKCWAGYRWPSETLAENEHSASRVRCRAEQCTQSGAGQDSKLKLLKAIQVCAPVHVPVWKQAYKLAVRERKPPGILTKATCNQIGRTEVHPRACTC